MRRIAGVLLLLLALSACSDKPDPIPGVEEFRGLAHDHVGGSLTYPQAPPVGGPHNRQWLACGVYDQPVPDEFAVHSLEHGAVWLAFRPDLPAASLDKLRRLAQVKADYTLVAPYPGLTEPVVAVAWGLRLPVTSVDDPRLDQFVRRYAGGAQGGEKGVGCVNGVRPPQSMMRAAQVTQIGERITGYVIDLGLEQSGVLRVRETIDYDFGRNERHGIFRTIPVRFPYDSRYERVYPIRDIRVSGSPGTPTDVDVSDQGGVKKIRIGDEDRTITGRHRYLIEYEVVGAVNRFPDHDELYWNAIGGEWSVGISNARVNFTGPAGVTQVACFTGPVGSNLPCRSAAKSGPRATFTQPSMFPFSALTMVVALPKDAVAAPGPVLDERFSLDRAFARTPATVSWAGLLLALGLGGVVLLTWRTGRDRRFVGEVPGLLPPPGVEGVEETRPLFAGHPESLEFTPPEGMRPALMGVLVDESADPLDVTATIIDLAVRRHLRIDELPRKWFFSRQDWQLTRLDPAPADELLTWERTLLDALFETGPTVELSDLKNTFHTDLVAIKKQLYADVMARKWFTRRPDTARGVWFGLGLLVALVGVGITILLATFTHLALIGLPVVFTGILLLVVHRRMPARTARGSAALAQALGFQRYLHTAEQAQLQYEETAGVFARYLPYAVVLGETKHWAKAFAGLGATEQDVYWYGGPSGFHINHFADSVSAFSVTAAGTVASTPGSSGGSGFSGGSSGGGGGGGGGGSW